MNRELWIRLPFPVSVNDAMGKKYKSKRWQDLSQHVSRIAFSLADGNPLMGSLEVTYYFQKDDFIVYDITNFMKLTDDAFTFGGLWGDDFQLDHCHQHRCRVGDPGEDWAFVHIEEKADIPELVSDRASRSPEEIKRRTALSKAFRMANPKPKKRIRRKAMDK